MDPLFDGPENPFPWMGEAMSFELFHNVEHIDHVAERR
jgi:hypothetical protein